MKVRLFVAAVAATLSTLVLVAPAGAQTTQNGLVNINLSDVTVQVPIGVAANVCSVTVGLIANVTQAGNTTTCTAVANSTAQNVTVGAPSSGSTTQNGLVNVNISNTTIQVPVAAAVNLCGVNAAILAVLTQTGDNVRCDATAGSTAGH